MIVLVRKPGCSTFTRVSRTIKTSVRHQFSFTARRFISASTASTLCTFTNAATHACNTSRIKSGSFTASSLNVYSMSSGRTSAAVFTQSKTLKMQSEPLQTGNCLAHSGHALMSGFGCSCFRPQSGHPCCFVVWKLSSFRLRHLTAVRTFENQIVSHSGVSDRSSEVNSGFSRRSRPPEQCMKFCFLDQSTSPE